MRDIRTIRCRIRIGKNARAPLKQMRRAADKKHPGWFGIDPETVRCGDCGCKWDTSSLAQVETVSCSNCYSDNVWLTALRVEMAPFDASGNNL